MDGTISDGWSNAARISLDSDFTYRRAAAEPTEVYVAQDDSSLDIASKNEFYVVCGDANDLSTEPALFLKWIGYIGAEKGTELSVRTLLQPVWKRRSERRPFEVPGARCIEPFGG